LFGSGYNDRKGVVDLFPKSRSGSSKAKLSPPRKKPDIYQGELEDFLEYSQYFKRLKMYYIAIVTEKFGRFFVPQKSWIGSRIAK
jgi:hypothetical protein